MNPPTDSLDALLRQSSRRGFLATAAAVLAGCILPRFARGDAATGPLDALIAEGIARRAEEIFIPFTSGGRDTTLDVWFCSTGWPGSGKKRASWEVAAGTKGRMAVEIKRRTSLRTRWFDDGRREEHGDLIWLGADGTRQSVWVYLGYPFDLKQPRGLAYAHVFFQEPDLLRCMAAPAADGFLDGLLMECLDRGAVDFFVPVPRASAEGTPIPRLLVQFHGWSTKQITHRDAPHGTAEALLSEITRRSGALVPRTNKPQREEDGSFLWRDRDGDEHRVWASIGYPNTADRYVTLSFLEPPPSRIEFVGWDEPTAA